MCGACISYFAIALNVRIDSRLQWPFYDDALGSGSWLPKLLHEGSFVRAGAKYLFKSLFHYSAGFTQREYGFAIFK